MPLITIEEGQLKDLIKTALIDVLETRRDLVREIFEEAMEDVAFVKAVEAGMKSETVSREEVFAILDGNQ